MHVTAAKAVPLLQQPEAQGELLEFWSQLAAQAMYGAHSSLPSSVACDACVQVSLDIDSFLVSY